MKSPMEVAPAKRNRHKKKQIKFDVFSVVVIVNDSRTFLPQCCLSHHVFDPMGPGCVCESFLFDKKASLFPS